VVDGPSSIDDVAVVVEALQGSELKLVGQITDASNLALLCEVVDADAAGAVTGGPVRVIYKPVGGERPLWDFPEGTLAGREVATFEVSRAGGWGVVPPTVLRDGPCGKGSVQLWIGDPFSEEPDVRPVDVVAPQRVPEGWLSVVDGELTTGAPVTVVHEDRDDVRDVAVLDAVVNNADRKGSHLVRDRAGALWGFDHGVTFSRDPKLRTVLWGWSGKPLREVDLDRLEVVRALLDDVDSDFATSLAVLLPRGDVRALRRRVTALLRVATHPRPSGGWPAIPWPAL